MIGEVYRTLTLIKESDDDFAATELLFALLKRRCICMDTKRKRRPSYADERNIFGIAKILKGKQ